jgi:hypothetical protein
MRTGRKARGNATQAAGQKPKPGGKAPSSGNTGSKTPQQTQSMAKPRPAATLTHEQIAQRAEHLWRQGGCLSGRDEQNWQEAEAQLRAELDVN